MPFPVLDQPDITRVLFHPRPEYAMVVEDAGSRSVSFIMSDGVIVGGRLHPAESTAPLLLFFHGNGEIASDYDDLAPVYRGLGLTLLVVDYRGYGSSTGSPSATALIDDALAVFKGVPALAAAHGLTPSAWLVMGRSLGSAAALAVAAAHVAGEGPTPAALIIESGFVETLSLIKRLGGVVPLGADEDRDGFGNRARIAAVTVPTLVIHGRDDWIIPATEGERLFRASGATDKRLVMIEGAGHNDLMMVGAEAYFAAIHRLVQGRQPPLPP